MSDKNEGLSILKEYVIGTCKACLKSVELLKQANDASESISGSNSTPKLIETMILCQEVRHLQEFHCTCKKQ